jgi:hypothetical protein
MDAFLADNLFPIVREKEFVFITTKISKPGLWALGSGLWALGSGLWALGSGLWIIMLVDFRKY